VGSLLALWLAQQGPAPLVLLGRLGRPGADSDLHASSFGDSLVTLARCDVASAEEAAGILHAVAASRCQPLQVLLPLLYSKSQHAR
jgi:hypothetical protein